ncbi:telomere-protecting terminal protein Tpg [Streptomyces spiramyceticus]|uniref:telomere-protecting terminal protein Tpg n=1 Tax=Streptomyces spiramyceticus TaxID=299717 RepID=UPI00237C2C1A|nr:hypothetical protein [Streptomyces spiramyceticus]
MRRSGSPRSKGCPAESRRRDRHHRRDRARFGFTAPPGSTDDCRIRLLTQHLPAAYAARLFEARDAGAEENTLKDIVAEGLQEQYFKDGGRHAQGLIVEFTNIDYIDLGY